MLFRKFFAPIKTKPLPLKEEVESYKLTRKFAYANHYEQCLRDVSDFLVQVAYADDWENLPWPDDFDKARKIGSALYKFASSQKEYQTEEKFQQILEMKEVKNLYLDEYDVRFALKIAKEWFHNPSIGFLWEDFYQKNPYAKPV